MMPFYWQIVAVGIAGGLGTMARLGTNQLMASLCGLEYPWGTTAVNLLGSFLFGFLVIFFFPDKLPVHWKVILLTGFMGGYTTFSSYAFEIAQFLEKKQYALALLHFSVQNILGIAAVFAGLRLGRLLT